MAEESHEFTARPSTRMEFLEAAFERQPDIETAAGLFGMEVKPPSETLGRDVVAVFVPRGAPSSEPLVTVVYTDDLAVSWLDLGSEEDAAALLADQYDPEYEGLVFQLEVNGHPAVAWSAADVPLRKDERGLEVPGTGIVLTASQVMWTDGTCVCWVTHPTLPHEELLKVARSMA